VGYCSEKVQLACPCVGHRKRVTASVVSDDLSRRLLLAARVGIAVQEVPLLRSFRTLFACTNIALLVYVQVIVFRCFMITGSLLLTFKSPFRVHRLLVQKIITI
jgi:hypothetical protein